MSKFTFLTGFLAILIVSALMGLRQDEPVRATNTTGEIVVVGEGAYNKIREANLPQSVRMVSSLSEVPEPAGVLILDRSSLLVASGVSAEGLRAQILGGATVIALDVPIKELQQLTRYSELRHTLGIREEDDKDIAVPVPSVPFYSFIMLDYAPASNLVYGGGGQKVQATLETDLGRFLDFQVVHDGLRGTASASP